MALVCVGGAKVNIPMPPGYSLLEKQEDTIVAGKQLKLVSTGEALISADIEAWAASYITGYEKPGYNQGKLGNGSVTITNVAQKVASAGDVLTMETKITLNLNVIAPGPAKAPNTPPDVAPPPPIEVSFSDAGQDKLCSV